MENNTISKQLFEHYNGKQPVKTLRDEFAMAALVGNLSYSLLNPMWGNYHENYTSDELAETCYDIADAMMKARERNG